MNKYQRAYDYLSLYIASCPFEDTQEGHIENGTQSHFKFEQWKTIKELVDKATPKKPEYEGDGYYKGEIIYDTWICPSCGERYEVDYHDYEYCPKCGQHIDWGEEDG